MSMNIGTRFVDCTHGIPAAGVSCRLDWFAAGAWVPRATGTTGRDGEVTGWAPERSTPYEPGRYRVVIDCGTYFAELGIATCLPEISIVFVMAQPDRRYHVEVMASAYGYGVYCGTA